MSGVTAKIFEIILEKSLAKIFSFRLLIHGKTSPLGGWVIPSRQAA